MKNEMLKNLIGPGIAFILMSITAAIAFSVDDTIADHNEADKAHPSVILAMESIKAQVGLIKQEQKLNQKSNVEAHARSDKAQERMMDALVRIDEKLSR